MKEIIVNIYWNDLSEEGKETLISSGFEPSEDQVKETLPIGVIATGKTEEDVL